MENLTDKELNELLTLAKAATPGPWRIGWWSQGTDPRAPLIHHNGPGAPICRFDRPGAPHKDIADAAYIAAANPATLRRLLLELQHLRAATPAAGAAEGAWVAVGDRLPEMLPDKATYGSAPDEDDYDEEDALNCRRSAPLLVYAKPFGNSTDTEVFVAYFKGLHEWETVEDGWCLWEVTHWQPLPAAPTTPPAPGIVALPPASHGGNTRNVLNAD